MKATVPFVAIPPTDAPARVVLVVDDDADIRSTIVPFLQRALPRTRILGAESGAEALKLLYRENVDVVVTDFRMPGMDGLELLAQARTIAPDAIRIMLTAYPDVDLAKRAVNDEAVLKFLTKPIEPEELAGAVRQAVDEAERRVAKRRSIAQQLGHDP